MLDVSAVIGHREWATGRKSDPTYDMNWRRERVARFAPKTEDDVSWSEELTEAGGYKTTAAGWLIGTNQKATRADANSAKALELLTEQNKLLSQIAESLAKLAR